jgi:hypothetical protein
LETLGTANGRNIQGLGTQQIISIAKDYGGEVGVGGRLTWKRGSIDVQPHVQDYDIQALWGDRFEGCNRMEIKRIFHEVMHHSVGIFKVMKEFFHSRTFRSPQRSLHLKNSNT